MAIKPFEPVMVNVSLVHVFRSSPTPEVIRQSGVANKMATNKRLALCVLDFGTCPSSHQTHWLRA